MLDQVPGVTYSSGDIDGTSTARQGKSADRDAEVLRLMEQGLKARSVARKLGISDSTVSRAWRRAMARRSADLGSDNF